MLADRLLSRLDTCKSSDRDKTDRRNYSRDHLCDMLIISLEQSDRISEIIPLCKAEAKLTGSYQRLVGRLIEDRQYEEAELWIVTEFVTLLRNGRGNSIRW